MIPFTKIFIILLLLQLYSLAAPLPALCFQTYKVAIIPLINTAECKDNETLQLINSTTAGKFKYPFYEIIATETVTTALKGNTASKNVTTKATMKELSASLPADIIIAIDLVRAKSLLATTSLWDFHSRDNTYVDTDVVIQCYTYSAADDNYLAVKVSESGIEPMTIDTSVYKSVERLMDQITSKLPYKRVPPNAITGTNNSM